METQWQKLIQELHHVGFTYYKIALLMSAGGYKTQYTQVERWARGSKMPYEAGELLIKLHAQHVGKPVFHM